MISFIKLLQHPLIKIFSSPFAFIAIGTIVGMSHSQNIQWLSAFLLILIMISSQLIDHFFHQREIQQNSKAAPEIILYICEGTLVISTIVFALLNHWLLTLMIILYIAFIHLQYIPFLFVNTFYQYLLVVFFYSFTLNNVAYYTQTSNIATEFLVNLIPALLITAGITIEMHHLKYLIINQVEQSPLYHWTGIGLSIIGLLTGFYFALPSTSYYLVQILFFLIVGICLIPMIIEVNSEKKRQNKINYLSSTLLVFTIFYSLAIIF